MAPTPKTNIVIPHLEKPSNKVDMNNIQIPMDRIFETKSDNYITGLTDLPFQTENRMADFPKDE
jgi:hypothetical protein